MKFTGRELFDLGVPKSKIKLFVDRDFESVEELKSELAPKQGERKEKVFTWVDWLMRTFPVTWLPMALKGDLPVAMSRGELKRLFDSKSIEINGSFPTSQDECRDSDFPIQSFVWFPKSKKKRTTWV